MPIYNLKNIYTKIKDVLFGTKFKKISSISFLLIILFLAYSIKTVPNYAKKSGYEIVWRSDYDKYQEGYCLAENRILSQEEIFKIGISQYLEKDLKLGQLSSDFLCSQLDFIGHCDYKDRGVSVDYYTLDELNPANWYELITSRYNPENTGQGYRELFFKELNATKTDPTQYLTIDLDSMTAGVSKPIIMYVGNRAYSLYLDKSFILKKDYGYSFSLNYIFFSERNKVKEQDKSDYYFRINKRLGIGDFKIDHCGNVEYDIRQYEERRDKL